MALLTLSGTLPDALPVHDDGTDYPFAMVHENRVIFADTRAELAGYLTGCSQTEDEGEALFIRYLACVNFANMLQPRLAAAADEAGVFSAQTASESVLTALFADRYEKVDNFTKWNQEVPLVLVASGYAPYTANPRPAGNIIWLDPFTDETFLESLSAAGIIDLHDHRSHAA